MSELFTRTEVNFGGAFTAQKGIVTSANGLTGVLMQNIQLTYQQQVSRIYELGIAGAITNVYYVSGRSQGQMSVAHVVGPNVSIANYYANFGDVCQAGQNTILLDLTPDVCTQDDVGTATGSGGSFAESTSYTVKYCVLTSIGMSVAAQDFIINENSQIMFSGLSYTGP